MLILLGEMTQFIISVLFNIADICTGVILGDILPSGILLVSASLSSTTNFTQDRSPATIDALILTKDW
jgi:uncharacterized repeat protein (TIGR01451 family)